MRSYVKIFGPPVSKAIKELEKIAIDMPQVSITDTIIARLPSSEDYSSYFAELGKGPLSAERSGKIISKSGDMLGNDDFFFEWFKEPTHAELFDLIEKIDAALTPLGCKYTITTRRR